MKLEMELWRDKDREMKMYHTSAFGVNFHLTQRKHHTVSHKPDVQVSPSLPWFAVKRGLA